MNKKNINISIGKKIKTLRDNRGIGQEELANFIGIERPTLSNIESGNRKLKIEEMIKVTNYFNISFEDLVNDNVPIEVVLENSKVSNNKSKETIRISVPAKNVDKLKEVLIYILNKVGSKPNIGETVIYKLLYFIDFDYYEKYEEQIIGATYIKNHYGPTPIEFKKIVETMISNDEIIKVPEKFFGYPQTKYLPKREADLSKLSGRELDLIESVLEKHSDKNAKEISKYSHDDVPWLTTNKEDIINYEKVFYRTPPYSVRSYEEDSDENEGELEENLLEYIE